MSKPATYLQYYIMSSLNPPAQTFPSTVFTCCSPLLSSADCTAELYYAADAAGNVGVVTSCSPGIM